MRKSVQQSAWRGLPVFRNFLSSFLFRESDFANYLHVPTLIRSFDRNQSLNSFKVYPKVLKSKSQPKSLISSYSYDNRETVRKCYPRLAVISGWLSGNINFLARMHRFLSLVCYLWQTREINIKSESKAVLPSFADDETWAFYEEP